MSKRPEDRVTDEGLAYSLSKGEKAAAERATKWPRRNQEGRITDFRHLLEVVTVLLVVGLIAVALVDALSAWVRIGAWGDTGGWLGGIMAFWLYVEEFRSWRGIPGRGLAALTAGLVSVASGLVVGWLLSGFLPPLLNGAAGVSVAAYLYAPLWFFAIRRAADREAGA